MVKAPVEFNVPGERWIQRATFGGDPIKDCAFEALRVIRSGIRRALLYLDPSKLESRAQDRMKVVKRTKFATCSTSSSDPLSKRSSRPGTVLRSALYTLCSLFCLMDDGSETSNDKVNNKPYSFVNNSTGSSASSMSRRIPLVRSVWTRHKAWTVRPK
jgi:hypothetical protein